MADSTTQMIPLAGPTQGPLAVGDRQRREKREKSLPLPKSRSQNPEPRNAREGSDDRPSGRAIDIRI